MWNVILLGLVSFFSDISAEMVYPIIPLYLTTVFGATPALVGVIEGIAESLASLLKVFSGYITDKWGRKKPVAFVGYAAGLVYKAAKAFEPLQGTCWSAKARTKTRWEKRLVSIRRWTWQARPSEFSQATC